MMLLSGGLVWMFDCDLLTYVSWVCLFYCFVVCCDWLFFFWFWWFLVVGLTAGVLCFVFVWHLLFTFRFALV